jgi:pimeloyl-ACP methyl ester carboxylesterase
MPHSWRRRLSRGALTLLGVFSALVFALWSLQERLIYPAPHYVPEELAVMPPGLTALRDPANAESVVGFYRAPADGSALSKLWLTFGGNGDVALRWDPLLAESATAGTGILMVEYPGYGARAGAPSPESLRAGAELSLRALSKLLGVSVAELEEQSSLLGYSLGSAAALDYAVRHPPQRIVLVAPFTSMLDMARLSVGNPLCYLLRHRYDNVASLRALQARTPPSLTILHGANDSLIPHRMGSELAALAPGSHFELVPGADHGDVVELAQWRLRALMAE